MNISLNFSDVKKEKLLERLRKFEQLETKSRYEELRCRAGESAVTFYKSGKLLIQGQDAEQVKKELLHNIGVGGELLLGIDETGRGENFGAFVVAGVLGDANRLRALRDSKKIGQLEKAEKEVLLHSEGHLVLVREAAEIDALRGSGKNMNAIEAEMIAKIAQNFREKGFKGRILVDGKPLNKGLQGIEFLVKGDDLNPVIGAASVLAKAAREKSKDRAKRKSWKN